jgi:hypothetical protein
MKGAYHLADTPAGPIRLYCPECHRFAQSQRDHLMQLFGADMPSFPAKLKPCDRPNFNSARSARRSAT